MRTAKKTSKVGKAELAQALRWSRPKLDRRLDEDPRFPVLKRGQRGGGWEFDLPAVLAYLGVTSVGDARPAPQTTNKPSAPPASRKPAKAAAARAEAPLDGAPGVQHHGEQTAAQRLKNAQAAREEDKLRQARRELVEAEEMRMVLGTMLAHLGKGLDGLPDTLVRRLGLQEEAGETIREQVDDLRRAMVNDLQVLLTA